MSTHAILGASGAHRWRRCPGSVRLSEGQPDVTSVYAQEGTAAHVIAEDALRHGRNADQYVGHVEDDVTITAEIADGVQVYLDAVNDEIGAGGDNVEIYLEEKFDLSPLDPPGDMFGTGDCVLWWPKEKFLDLWDYKNGFNPVEVEANDQLMYYALGAVVKLGVKPEKIRVSIVQPNALHRDGPVRSDEFTWEDLVDFKRRLFADAKRTQEKDAPLAVGSWCKFCKAQAVCPAQKAVAIEVAQTEFETLPEPTPPDQLTQEEILRVLEYSDVIEDWIGSIRAYVQAGLERGEEVPGWKLVDKRATRRWKDQDDVLKFLKRKRVPKKEYMTDPKLKSPAQLEAVLKAKLPRGQKKGALPEELVESKSSGFTMAPDSDARIAVQAHPGDEFEALPAPSDDN